MPQLRTIWKFPVPIGNRVTLSIPRGATMISVQFQGPEPVMWAIVNPAALRETRVFRWFGTGHELPDSIGLFVGTVQEGPLVWHLFEDRGDG